MAGSKVSLTLGGYAHDFAAKLMVRADKAGKAGDEALPLAFVPTVASKVRGAYRREATYRTDGRALAAVPETLTSEAFLANCDANDAKLLMDARSVLRDSSAPRSAVKTARETIGEITRRTLAKIGNAPSA